MTYNEYIQTILIERGHFGISKDEYKERHHIKPKCLGGSNDKENLIDLYPQEHFIAHKLLAQENPNNIKLTRAYACMAFASNDKEQRYELTPEEYKEAREYFSTSLKKYYSDKTNHPCYGKHLSEERKKAIGDINRGNKYCVGRVISEETRRKIGDANRNPSAETRKKMSDAQKARNLTGGNNPKAKAVIRLSDKTIYSSAKEAAQANNINYSTFKNWVQQSKNGFMYYKVYQQQENI